MKRATVELVFNHLEADDFHKLYVKFMDLVNHYNVSEKSIAELCNNSLGQQRNSEENSKMSMKEIVKFLNVFEHISIGVRENAFHEFMLKKSHKTAFTFVWDSSKELVYKMRENLHNERAYVQFEWLAERWKNDPIKPSIDTVIRDWKDSICSLISWYLGREK